MLPLRVPESYSKFISSCKKNGSVTVPLRYRRISNCSCISIANPRINICTNTPRIKKNIFYVNDADFLDVSVVYNLLTLNVGPPLGLIKYKKESYILMPIASSIMPVPPTAPSIPAFA
jgi:hypothetical protein